MINIPIKIGKQQYFIRSDSKNWMVGKIVKDKEKEKFSPEMFFSTVEGCMQHLLERKLKQSNAVTIAGLKAQMTKARKELTGIYGKVPFDEKGKN